MESDQRGTTLEEAHVPIEVRVWVANLFAEVDIACTPLSVLVIRAVLTRAWFGHAAGSVAYLLL